MKDDASCGCRTVGVHGARILRGRTMLAKPPRADLPAAVSAWAATFGKVLTWDDMAWLRSITTLPLVLKGIPELA